MIDLAHPKPIMNDLFAYLFPGGPINLLAMFAFHVTGKEECDSSHLRVIPHSSRFEVVCAFHIKQNLVVKGGKRWEIVLRETM